MKTRLFLFSFIICICGLHISIAQQSKDIDKTSNTTNARTITNARTVEELSIDPINVKRIELTRKELTVFPKEILACVNVEELTLSNNKLTSIPSEISQLTKLKRLLLRSNELTTLPASIKIFLNYN